MELDEILGIDPSSPLDQRAEKLLNADRQMLKDLVARREELGLTQSEVARRMDIGQPAVARIESGTRDLHQSTLRRYAMAVEAVVEHRVVADDPAHVRSAALISNLRPHLFIGGHDWEHQVATHGPVKWAGVYLPKSEHDLDVV